MTAGRTRDQALRTRIGIRGLGDSQHHVVNVGVRAATTQARYRDPNDLKVLLRMTTPVFGQSRKRSDNRGSYGRNRHGTPACSSFGGRRTIGCMDNSSRREWMREWIAPGLRERLTFVELSHRTGVHIRTLRRWNARFRSEVGQSSKPDRDEQTFVDLVERTEMKSGRIEIVLPDKRSVVLDGGTLIVALARLLRAAESC